MSFRLALQDTFRARSAARDAPAIAALLQAERNMRVLDLGGGTGLAAELVAPQCIVSVVEPDPGKVARGHLERPRFGFIEARAQRLPFPDHHFERALALLSFHHVPADDQGLALREVRRVLVPGGRLVMQEVSGTEGPGRWLHLCARRGDHGVAMREAPELAGMVEDAGFADPVVQPARRGYLLAARAPM